MIIPSPPSHTPVMLRQVLETLAPKDGGVYVDATFGRGGYTKAILKAARTKVYAIDRDPDAIEAAAPLVQANAGRLEILHGPFGDMQRLLQEKGVTSVDGIVFDLGVSSPQLDQAARGFSFQKDGPLDMRMAQTGETAADFVNHHEEREIADIIFGYGEERYARRVARAIVADRVKEPFLTTTQLAGLVRRVVPRSADGIDPATRTFQALRIAVNDEMGELERGLAASEQLLKPSGRLVVVAFHSTEDRVVKEFLRARSGNAPNVSRHIPITKAAPATTFHALTRKPMIPTDDDIAGNIRARSARLRAAERADSSCAKENAA